MVASRQVGHAMVRENFVSSTAFGFGYEIATLTTEPLMVIQMFFGYKKTWRYKEGQLCFIKDNQF